MQLWKTRYLFHGDIMLTLTHSDSTMTPWYNLPEESGVIDNMEALLVALIQQLNGAVFTLIAVLVVSFILIFKAGSISQSFKIFQKKHESIDEKIDSIKTNIAKIGATTDLLYQAHLSTIGAHSPISLTEKGKAVSEAISAEEKVNSHWDAIKAKLEAQNPVNPYDIQTVAMNIARECFEKIFTETEKNEIKTHAYRIGMNLLEIYPIIGVIIRNKIFGERNLDVEEVDRHAPNGSV